MLGKRRVSFFVAVTLVGMAVVMTLGLPFGQLGWTSVKAQYSPSAEGACGTSVYYQVRLRGDTMAYADPELTRPAFLISTAGSKAMQKYLVCSDTINKKSWAIFIAINLVYIPAGSGQIVPRAYQDSQ
jgi:hypothetical protein